MFAVMLTFKQKPEDFLVREELGRTPSGSGDFLYLYLHKKNYNTMDVILSCCKYFELDKQSITVCGLKDKKSIAQQRFCFDTTQRKKGITIQILTEYLSAFGQITQTTFHNVALYIGAHRANHFTITLKQTHKHPIDVDEILEHNSQKIQTYGIPNAYGIQRFGRKMRNFSKAQAFLKQNEIPVHTYMSKFILKAYPNAYFNAYALQRYYHKQRVLEGDIVVNTYGPDDVSLGMIQNNKIHMLDTTKIMNVSKEVTINPLDYLTEQFLDFDAKVWHATGPMMGRGLLIAPFGTLAGMSQEHFLHSPLRDETIVHNMQTYRLRGLRRPLFVIPTDFGWTKNENNDYIISFGLPTGSYATILLGQLFVGCPQMIQHHRWYIPTVLS